MRFPLSAARATSKNEERSASPSHYFVSLAFDQFVDTPHLNHFECERFFRLFPSHSAMWCEGFRNRSMHSRSRTEAAVLRHSRNQRLSLKMVGIYQKFGCNSVVRKMGQNTRIRGDVALINRTIRINRNIVLLLRLEFLRISEFKLNCNGIFTPK